MSDLFDALRQDQRRRLRAAGWHEAAGLHHGVPMWRRPDGSAILTEEEAIAQMEREKKSDA